MKIGYDISQTGGGKAGCGYMADSMIRMLAEIDRDNEYMLSLLSKLDSGYGNLDSMQAESPQSVPGVGRQKPLKQAFWGNRSLTEGGLRRAA